MEHSQDSPPRRRKNDPATTSDTTRERGEVPRVGTSIRPQRRENPDEGLEPIGPRDAEDRRIWTALQDVKTAASRQPLTFSTYLSLVVAVGSLHPRPDGNTSHPIKVGHIYRRLTDEAEAEIKDVKYNLPGLVSHKGQLRNEPDIIAGRRQRRGTPLFTAGPTALTLDDARLGAGLDAQDHARALEGWMGRDSSQDSWKENLREISEAHERGLYKPPPYSVGNAPFNTHSKPWVIVDVEPANADSHDWSRVGVRFEQCTTSEERFEQCTDSADWSPAQGLAQMTCSGATYDEIVSEVPGAPDDTVMHRWGVYALFTDWTDKDCDLRIINVDVLRWIGAGRSEFCNPGGRFVGERVLSYVQQRLPDMEYVEHIPERRARLIKDDGLSGQLWKAVEVDLRKPASSYDTRVYALTGRVYNAENRTERRKDVAEEAAQWISKAPSGTTGRMMQRLNDRPLRGFSELVQGRIGYAYKYVERMPISIDLSAKTKKGKANREIERIRWKKKRQQRREYRKTLRMIETMAKPFYKPSSKSKTDRLFGLNRSLLDLPKPLRRILCEGLYEVDLKSAHLLIAAWLWDAGEVLDWLSQEENSIWDELMEHYRPLFEEQDMKVPEKGDRLYETVKAALKIAIYSTVYGMKASSIQGKVTKSLKALLGPDAGAHLREHWIIEQLLEKRDEKLEELDQQAYPTMAATDIEVVVEVSLDNEDGDDDFAGPRSAMATITQSYEQKLMEVILDLEEHRHETKNRPHFRVMLWIHDGAYVKMRSPNARAKDLNELLQQRSEELAEKAGKDTPLPAFFEIEKVEAPELPEPTEDQPCNTSNSTSSTTEDATTEATTTTATVSTEMPETKYVTIGEPKIPDPFCEPADGAASPSRAKAPSPAWATSTGDAPPPSDV